MQKDCHNIDTMEQIMERKDHEFIDHVSRYANNEIEQSNSHRKFHYRHC